MDRQGEDADVEPAVAQALEDTSVFSSTSSSSRFGEPVVQAGARRGAAGTGARVGNSPIRTLPDSGSWAWRAMLADVVGLAEHDPGPLDDLLAGRR